LTYDTVWIDPGCRGGLEHGAGMRVGSGNVSSKVPAKESREMQGSTAARWGVRKGRDLESW